MSNVNTSSKKGKGKNSALQEMMDNLFDQPLNPNRKKKKAEKAKRAGKAKENIEKEG